MTIVERMALHNFAGRLRIEPNGLNIADEERDGIRAALRSVKPEDVSDGQVEAFATNYADLKPGDNIDIKAQLLDRPYEMEALRRAIAAAIAAGGIE